ncbi:MAG: hypothetical protein HQK55_14800 [Deltaproteobacteria bacterium]|nr:hypothetical protein [Deltaproteobacteria bacterium]
MFSPERRNVWLSESPDEAIRHWAARALASGGDNLLGELTDHVAGIIILEALNMTGGNRTKAAELLGLSRPTLQAKMEKYNFRTVTSVKV